MYADEFAYVVCITHVEAIAFNVEAQPAVGVALGIYTQARTLKKMTQKTQCVRAMRARARKYTVADKTLPPDIRLARILESHLSHRVRTPYCEVFDAVGSVPGAWQQAMHVDTLIRIGSC